jgi:penicillin amidase
VTRRLAAAFGVALATSVLVAILGAAAFVMAPLPSRRGRVVVPGIQAPVTARFDRQGVPHLRAVLETDAWRALGFIHASDRLFQMELRRRAAAGRLAEVFGKRALRFDREARTHGYASLAQWDWDELPVGERAVLEAYAEGVNAFLAEQALPLEFRMLSLRPEPWRPVDSLAFGRLLQDNLSIAAGIERQAFDDARVRGLDSAIALYDASVPGSTHVARETADVLSDGASKAGEPGLGVEPASPGSNAWALAGTRTASGKPLLAGDPHLQPERPGVWYVAHLTTSDGLDAVGLTLAGLPGIAIGHDGRVAWSLTMHQADDSDLFLEHVDWAKGTYLRGGEWIPLAHEPQTIHVKGAPDDVLDVWRTEHGPIVLRLPDPPGFALARAFAPDRLHQGPSVFLEAARAKNEGELLSAWSRYGGPSVNVCWAAANGAVGVKVAGAIPRRLAGDGRFPVPGWVTTFDWNGMIAAAELPALTNPSDGIVATANDDWSVAGLKLPYPGLYASPIARDARASSAHRCMAPRCATCAPCRTTCTPPTPRGSSRSCAASHSPMRARSGRWRSSPRGTRGPTSAARPGCSSAS